MSLMFRPAGIPHQGEIAPGGLRFFHIELRPRWKRRLAECSGELERGCEDSRGGPLFWLRMNLFRETFAASLVDARCVQSLLAEMTGIAARLPLEERKHPPACIPCIFRACFGGSNAKALANTRAAFGFAPLAGICSNGNCRWRKSACCSASPTRAHFTREFRRVTELTPHAFRAQLLPAG